MNRRTEAVALGLAAALCCGFPAAAGEPAPYRLEVRAEYGHPDGPESLLDDLLQDLVAEIHSKRCFQEVAQELPGPPRENDLELAMTIDDFREETESEVSIATRSSPGYQSDAARRVVARVEAAFDLAVTTKNGSAPLRTKRFRQADQWRPLQSEDPRYRARRELIVSVVRRTRRFVCKGSASKWAAELDQVLASESDESR